MPIIRRTPGTSISIMGTTTTTTATTTNMFGWCAPESELEVATNELETVFQFKKVWQAYLSCRKRKQSTSSTQRYQIKLLDNLVATKNALQQHDYTPSRSLCFITLKPLIQVGNQVEIFNKDLSALSSEISKYFKADKMPRSGFSSSIAAPLKTSGTLKRELKKEHKAFIYITEAGYLKGGMKRRLLHSLYHPELMHETI